MSKISPMHMAHTRSNTEDQDLEWWHVRRDYQDIVPEMTCVLGRNGPDDHESDNRLINIS